MIKTYCIILFIIGFLGFVILFFNGAYREITATSELANRNYTFQDNFQNLSRQINKAAVLKPGLAEAGDSSKAGNEKLFFRDSLIIIRQLEQLNSLVKDSFNIQIAGELDKLVRSELSWILKSNVPYSINNKKSPGHIASY